VAHGAARLLRETFGAERVAAFGSLAHGAWFNPSSDIDLTALGIPAHQFYRAVAAVAGISPRLAGGPGGTGSLSAGIAGVN
jgi:predicted nucleotidyltransferase